MFFVITSLGVLYFIRYFIRMVNDFRYLVALCFNRFVSFGGLSQRIVQAGAQGVWRDYFDRSAAGKQFHDEVVGNAQSQFDGDTCFVFGEYLLRVMQG